MKHIKSYILLTWMAVSLVGCKRRCERPEESCGIDRRAGQDSE